MSHPTPRKDRGFGLTVTLDTKASGFLDTTLNPQADVKGDGPSPFAVTALIE